MGVLWKIISIIIDQLLADSIEFRNILHGIRAQKGTGTATLEAKLLQYITIPRQDVLYNIFVDIHKAYVALDWVHTLVIMEGFGVVPRYSDS